MECRETSCGVARKEIVLAWLITCCWWGRNVMENNVVWSMEEDKGWGGVQGEWRAMQALVGTTKCLLYL